MNRWVIDTSALIRLYVPDGPLPDGLESAVDLAARGDGVLMAPELLLAEVAQVLLKKERAGFLTSAEVVEIQRAADELPVMLVGHRELMAPASRIARQTGLTVYDALYVALARNRAAQLLTGDLRLEAAARA